MFGWFKKNPPDQDPPDQDSPNSDPPISYDDLKALFEWLGRPDPPACTHSHKETEEFLRQRNLPVEKTLAWLRSNGGFCDCEVIYNVTDEWGDKVGWEPELE